MNHCLLIIDDDHRSVEHLRREVKPLKIDVVVAYDQEAAFHILDNSVFSIALVDIKLKADPRDLNPNVEVGYATIRHLRRRYPRMVIIAVTAFDQKSEVNTNAIKAGASDFWSKNPDASDSLMAKIRGVLTNEQGDVDVMSFIKPEPVVGASENTIRSTASNTIEDVHKRIK